MQCAERERKKEGESKTKGQLYYRREREFTWSILRLKNHLKERHFGKLENIQATFWRLFQYPNSINAIRMGRTFSYAVWLPDEVILSEGVLNWNQK